MSARGSSLRRYFWTKPGPSSDVAQCAGASFWYRGTVAAQSKSAASVRCALAPFLRPFIRGLGRISTDDLPLSGHYSSDRYPRCHSVVRHYLLATGGMQWALRGTSVVLEVWRWRWEWARRSSQGTESPGPTPHPTGRHRRGRRHPPAPNRHEPPRAHHPAQVPVQDLYLATPRRRTGRTEG